MAEIGELTVTLNMDDATAALREIRDLAESTLDGQFLALGSTALHNIRTLASRALEKVAVSEPSPFARAHELLGEIKQKVAERMPSKQFADFLMACTPEQHEALCQQALDDRREKEQQAPSEPEVEELGELTVLRLQPNDIVCVMLDDQLSMGRRAYMQKLWDERFPAHKVLLVTDGQRIGVIRQDVPCATPDGLAGT